MKEYPNIEAFYAENEERRRSGEADYGVWWTESGGKSYPKWRVSYIQATGEVYAIQLIDGGKVQVLGVVPPDKNGKCYYKTLDKILDGWADICSRPGSLEGLRNKLAGYGED